MSSALTIEIFNIYINPITSVIGSFFCLSMYFLLKSSVFSQSFFFHLRVESLFMFLNLMIVVFQPISLADRSYIAYTYFAVVYHKYFIIYGRSICEMVVIFSNILSGISCYVFIRNLKFNFVAEVLRKKASLYFTLSLVSLSCAIFAYQLFEYQVQQLDNDNINSTPVKWHMVQLEYRYYSYFGLIAMLIRDGLGMFLLITMNVILLIKVLNRSLFIINLYVVL